MAQRVLMAIYAAALTAASWYVVATPSWNLDGLFLSIAMNHTFGPRIVEPADLHRGFGVTDYVDALAEGLRGHMVARSAGFVPFLLLAALGIGAYFRTRMRARETAARLLAAIWIATAARFLAFPLLGDRFMAPAYAYSIALFCALAPAGIRAQMSHAPSAGEPSR